MNIELLGFTLDAVGKILIAYTVISVHYRFWKEHKVDDVVNSLPMFPTLSEAIKIVALSFTKDISELSCCI